MKGTETVLLDRLPLTGDGSSPALFKPAGKNARTGTGLNVLLVEDDRIDAFLMLEALKSVEQVSGLIHASDGQEALDLIAGGMRPDVIILDLNMPRVDGLSLLQRLEEGGRLPCPVIVMTSSRTSEDAFRSYRRGAWLAITKPKNPQRYRIILAKTLAEMKLTRSGHPPRLKVLRTRFHYVPGQPE